MRIWILFQFLRLDLALEEDDLEVGVRIASEVSQLAHLLQGLLVLELRHVDGNLTCCQPRLLFSHHRLHKRHLCLIMRPTLHAAHVEKLLELVKISEQKLRLFYDGLKTTVAAFQIGKDLMAGLLFR